MEQYKLVRYFIDVYFRVCLDISSNSSCQKKGVDLEQAKMEIFFNQSRVYKSSHSRIDLFPLWICSYACTRVDERRQYPIDR